MTEQQERMRAIVQQALAEVESSGGGPVGTVHLIVYGDISLAETQALYESASAGTPAADARLILEQAGGRYICWNCCGLRFESEESVCPNCGEVALSIPSEIAFALRQVSSQRAGLT